MLTCPSCGEAAPDGAAWCEACGADLEPAAAALCTSCGEAVISADGYCMACGHKQPAERDHKEFTSVGDALGAVAGGLTVGVTDRGIRHHLNEDAVAVRGIEHGVGVLVVCDGVSSTPGSAEASLRAAVASRDLLVDRMRGAGAAAPTVEAVSGWLLEAASTAQDEAAASPEEAASAPYEIAGPPSSTFVAALGLPAGVSDGAATDGAATDGAATDGAATDGAASAALAVAWIGDSRAYWLPQDDPDGSVQLTVDHEIGGSLSRWIGADAPEGPVDVVIHDVDAAGWLLVCSDGLWRYASAPKDMWNLVDSLARSAGSPSPGSANAGSAEAGSPTAVLALAVALVDHAKNAGGHDNISVALWPAPVPPSGDVTSESVIKRTEETA